MTTNTDAIRRAAPAVALRAASPYPWPYDGAVSADRLGLLIVGAQHGIATRCARTAETLAAIERVAHATARAGGSIIRTRHGTAARRRPGPLPRPGSPGYAPLPGRADIVIDCPGFDAFFSTPLAQSLSSRSVTHLLICGLWLEGPVHSSLRAANDQGFECALLTDACAPSDPGLKNGAINSIEMSGGIFGAVASSDSALAALHTNPPEES